MQTRFFASRGTKLAEYLDRTQARPATGLEGGRFSNRDWFEIGSWVVCCIRGWLETRWDLRCSPGAVPMIEWPPAPAQTTSGSMVPPLRDPDDLVLIRNHVPEVPIPHFHRSRDGSDPESGLFTHSRTFDG